MYDKIYNNKDTFSNIDNNIYIKFTIFYDKYRQIKILLNNYIYDVSVMLANQA